MAAPAQKDPSDNKLPTATRTLLAAGFIITNVRRHPGLAEVYAEKVTVFGSTVKYLFAFTDQEVFTGTQREDIERSAHNERRTAAYIGGIPTEDQLGWIDFLDALGGEVPSWHALTDKYQSHLALCSQTKLPEGMKGEAWFLFEGLVADGLDFILGRRVQRLGAHKRGKRVSDMLAQLPDGALIVVDAKAAEDEFDASWSNLRALVEYVKVQKQRQRGHNDVFSALIVSSAFRQAAPGLLDLSRQFGAEVQVPLAFMTADALGVAVNELQSQVDLRNALRWKTIFAGGLVTIDSIKKEMQAAKEQRIAIGD